MLNKQNLILFFCSFIFCLYCFEVFLYSSRSGVYSENSVNRSMRINAAIAQGIEFDTRSRLEFIQDSQAQGKDDVLRISPASFTKSNGLSTGKEKIYPLAGVANRSTVFCNVHGDYLLFKSDQWGFRNSRNTYPRNSVDIAVIGDSFAMGHCENDDIASLLRQRKFTAVNLSYSSNGPLIELASLREYATKLKPKVLLWVYYEGNDLSNLRRERKSEILKQYLTQGYTQNLVDRQSEINDLLLQYSAAEQAKKQTEEKNLYSWFVPLTLSGTSDLLNTSLRLLIPKTRISNASQLALFEKTLNRAKLDTANWGGQMYFVYLPEWQRLAKKRLSITALQRNEVLNIVEQLDIPMIDLTEEMSSDKAPLEYFPFGLNGHYSAKGYSLLAERVSQELSKGAVTKTSQD